MNDKKIEALLTTLFLMSLAMSVIIPMTMDSIDDVIVFFIASSVYAIFGIIIAFRKMPIDKERCNGKYSRLWAITSLIISLIYLLAALILISIDDSKEYVFPVIISILFMTNIVNIAIIHYIEKPDVSE